MDWYILVWVPVYSKTVPPLRIYRCPQSLGSIKYCRKSLKGTLGLHKTWTGGYMELYNTNTRVQNYEIEPIAGSSILVGQSCYRDRQQREGRERDAWGGWVWGGDPCCCPMSSKLHVSPANEKSDLGRPVERSQSLARLHQELKPIWNHTRMGSCQTTHLEVKTFDYGHRTNAAGGAPPYPRSGGSKWDPGIIAFRILK